MPGDFGRNQLEANSDWRERNLMTGLMPIIRRARRPLIDADYRISEPPKVELSATIEAPALPPPLNETKPDELTSDEAQPDRRTGQRQSGPRTARK
jgi:hypothetical protein